MVDPKKTIALKVKPTDTVAAVKSKIHFKERIPPDEQRLLHAGRELQDAFSLESYNIQHKSTLQLFLKLKGKI